MLNVKILMKSIKMIQYINKNYNSLCYNKIRLKLF